MGKKPIEIAPVDGRSILVGDQAGNIAKAVWAKPHHAGDSGMWAYPTPEGSTLVEQIDFVPTHWSETASDFLDT